MPLVPQARQLYPLKPGLTGWAQLHVARSHDAKLDIRRQIEDDLFYLENWSLLLDSKIIVMTLFSRASYMLK
jgi:lipopolysaccharide/colanic/teichoic acid biosynthesis glycosyltransferase